MTFKVQKVAEELVGCVMLSPAGEYIAIPDELFQALRRFMGPTPEHRTGSLSLEFSDGGVAGIKASYKLK